VGVLLGIDVGGTKVAFAVGDGSGAVRASHRRPTSLSGDGARDLAGMIDDLRRLVREAGIAERDVDAVGVAVPSPLDPDRGVVLNPPNLPGWHEVPVQDLVHEAFGVPVFVENDANAAALAEWHFGAARGFQHAVYLTMSTGIGGGLILGGRLHRGIFASAGELGHAPVEWEGAPCTCGLRGCLEAYAGGASWTRRLREIAPPDSRATQLAGGRDAVKPEHVVAAARVGDAFALAEMARWNDYVARGITWIVMALAPEAVVLGTIAVAAGEELAFAPIREQVRRHVWPFLGGPLQILPAALGSTLPYRAAIGVAFEGLRSIPA
jgi:glucokinase